jgi:Family of unknown function (DUF5760)
MEHIAGYLVNPLTAALAPPPVPAQPPAAVVSDASGPGDGAGGAPGSGEDADPPATPSETAFVHNVRLYLKLHDDIAQRSKEVGALRKQKQELKDYIIHYMRTNSVEQCVSDSGKLYIAKTKSSQPVNKDYIFSTLSNDLGVQAAERLVEALWSNREVTVKETLRRTKAK